MKHSLILASVLYFAGHAWGVAQSTTRDFRKAEKLYASYEYAAAIPYYQAAIASDSSGEAVVKIADCYRRINNYDKAEYYYSLMARQGAGEPIDRLFYGIVLKAQGKYQEAKQQFLIYRDAAPIDARGVRLANSCDIALRILEKPAEYRVEPATALNSPRADFSPSRYRNGYVFASTREGSTGSKTNTRTGDPYTDLYYAEKVQDGFSNPTQFGGNINTASDEGPAVFNGSGTEMYFTKSVTVKGNPDLGEGTVRRLRIYSAEFIDGQWKNIKSLPFNDDDYNVAHPALSKDGRRLYFSSDMRSGSARGGKDLYVSERSPDGRWGSPINLGSLINTEGDEVFPYIHDDGTLYFASDLQDGLGGLDIFYAEQRDGIFSEPKNMMKGINSSADDFGIVLDPDKRSGLISSNRVGGVGSDDIYYVFKIDNLYEPKDLEPEEKPTYLVVSGRVIEVLAKKNGNDWNKIRGDVLDNALLLLMDNNSRVEAQDTSNLDGTYSFDVSDPDNYIIIGKKRGYWASKNRIDKASLVDGRVTMDIELEKIVLNEPNPNGRLKNVHFDFDQAVPNTASQTILDIVAGTLAENPEIVVELAGHTDPRGTDAYNMALSIRRAKSVSNFLQSRGIEKGRIIEKGYGERKLLIPNPRTEEQQARNRRTEFIVRRTDYGTKPGEVLQQGTFNFDSGSDRPLEPAIAPAEKNSSMPSKPAASADYHVVKSGETLYGIAKRYNIQVVELMRLNGLKSEMIRVDQKLRIR
jgi:outer membrane protein OmpA-like peptidoglycan-associated protein